MLGTRVGDKYEWKTYREIADLAEHLSYGCKALELYKQIEFGGQGYKMLGIQSKNRWEWVLVHLANMYQAATTVAVFDCMPAEQIAFVVEQSEITCMFVSVDNLEAICNSKSKLTTVVCFDPVSDELKSMVQSSGLTLLSLEDVINKGREAHAEVVEPTPEDCFIISFTSGSFGNPKGVMITHKMALQCAAAV